jgi:hypothetical protein
METKSANLQLDPLLAQFIAESDEEKAGAVLSRLISDHAEPVISRIIRWTLPESLNRNEGNDFEDLKNDVMLRLLEKVRSYRLGSSAPDFNSFQSYVAVITYNACYTFLRAKHPQRWRLKNRIRYALRHEPGLAIWEAQPRLWLCGLDRWQQNRPERCPPGKLRAFSSDWLKQVSQPGRTKPQQSPVPLIRAVLSYTESPVELDELVDLVAGVWGIQDHATRVGPNSPCECGLLETLAADAARQDDLYAAKLSVRMLWSEIRALPQKQAMALLLGLKDSQGVDGISLLGNAGVASLRDISGALGVEAASLSKMWDEMPMDDSKIGDYLGVRAQQVANLRKSARKRLAFRMRRLKESDSRL